MRENIRTENSKISSYRQPSYSIKQISHSQIFDATHSKKSIFLRESYNQIKLPHFQTQIIIKQDSNSIPEESNYLISGKPYITKAMVHQYLRIYCQNEIGPMSCQILCTSEFQIMVSQSQPFPTNYNCDQLVNNRGFVVSVIMGEYIFISIITRKDAEVRFNIQFQQIYDETLRIKTLQDTPRQELSKSNNSKSIQQIVLSNKEMAGIKKNKYQDEISRQEKFLKVLSTRNFQRESKNQAKVQKKFELTARQLANKEKILIRIINDKRSIRITFESQWALLLFLIKMSQKIVTLFNHKKKIIQQHRLASFKIKFHLKKLRQALSTEKGDGLPARALFESFQAIKAKTKLIRSHVRKQQVEKILPILRQRAQLYEMKIKLLHKANKMQIIKKYVLMFEENYFRYKNEMIAKWDFLNEKIKDEEIKEKQPNLRNRAFVTWFHVLKDKEFAQQMRRCFIFELMRDRIRQHLEDQKVIKKYRNDLRYYQQKLRVCREPSEANALRIEIFALTNDIYAMHMKNQLFIHCDVEKYFHRLVSKYIVLIDEPDNLPVGFEIQQKQKQRQSRISLRRGMRKSKL